MSDDEHLRIDPLTGDAVYVVADRQDRPNLPAEGCPFCPGGLEAPEPYDVRWFPNRWPVFPDGRCEIVLYTPRHDAAFWQLTAAEARRVVDLWADRSAALGSRADVDYVLVFENRGPEVGATIGHPHGQIYAYDRIPPRPLAELTRDSTAAFGDEAVGDRQVTAVGGWRAWVPWAANYPFELLAAPVVPVPDLPSLDGTARDDLARLLIDVLGRLDRLFDEPMPYMLWFHQRPFDDGEWPSAWVHLHLAPINRAAGTPRFVAAGELGGELYFNPIEPAAAAERLRNA